MTTEATCQCSTCYLGTLPSHCASVPGPGRPEAVKPQRNTGPNCVRVRTLSKTRDRWTLPTTWLSLYENSQSGSGGVRAQTLFAPAPWCCHRPPLKTLLHSQTFGPPRCPRRAAAPSSDVSGKRGTLTGLRKKPNNAFS